MLNVCFCQKLAKSDDTWQSYQKSKGWRFSETHCTHIQTQTNIQRQTHRHTDTPYHIALSTHTDTDRHTYRQTDIQRLTTPHSERTLGRLHNILAQPYTMWDRHLLKCELCLSDDCSALDEDGHYSPGSASSVVVSGVSLNTDTHIQSQTKLIILPMTRLLS